jgi:NADPH-dependent 2,4-dienoyl-CoA reductase/sulfur reductase-like enzyme
MAAAIAAVAHGCAVTLIDEAASPGGQIYRQAAPGLPVGAWAAPGEAARKQGLLDRFVPILDHIDYRPDTVAFAAFGNGEIHIARDGKSEVLRPDATILATGVCEQAIPFPGWTLPGVMFAGGAQAILKSQGVLPGKRAVIAGCGPLPLVVAAQFLRAGGTVQGLALLHPLTRMLTYAPGLWHGRTLVAEGLEYAWTVRRAGVRRLAGHVPIRALGVDGVEAVVLARLGADGRVVPGTEREIACDLLALNYGFAANSELAAMAGARMSRDDVGGGWIAEHDAHGRTSVPGLFVAGDGASLRGALVAEAEGALVGAAAAGASVSAATATAMRRHLAFQRSVKASLHVPPQLWNLTTDETIVCRCESVTCGQLRVAYAAGHRSLNAIKRNTRAAMGWCGGRTCLGAVAALCKRDTGATPQAMMTPRPMARPVTLGALAAQTVRAE